MTTFPVDGEYKVRRLAATSDNTDFVVEHHWTRTRCRFHWRDMDWAGKDRSRLESVAVHHLTQKMGRDVALKLAPEVATLLGASAT